MQVRRPVAHTRGSARGLIFFSCVDSVEPVATPIKPAATVMPPNIRATLKDKTITMRNLHLLVFTIRYNRYFLNNISFKQYTIRDGLRYNI